MRRFLSQSVTSRATVVSVGSALLFALTGAGIFQSRPVFGAEDDIVSEQPQVIDPDQPRVVRANDVIDRQLYLFLFGDTYTKNRRDLAARTDQRIRGIEVDYRLTKAELDSLVLAARADRVRFDREIEELRTAYETAQKNRKELTDLLSTLQSKIRTNTVVPNSNSFFEKKTKAVLAGKVKVPRFGENHQFSSDLLQNRHKADVEAAVRAIERTVTLRAAQREAIVDLLFKHTQPAKVFGDFDDIVVRYRLAQVPEDTLKPIFDQDQWPKVLSTLDSFREFGPFLKRHGLVANEPVGARTALTRKPK